MHHQLHGSFQLHVLQSLIRRQQDLPRQRAEDAKDLLSNEKEKDGQHQVRCVCWVGFMYQKNLQNPYDLGLGKVLFVVLVVLCGGCCSFFHFLGALWCFEVF